MKNIFLIWILAFNVHAQTIESVVAASPGGPDDTTMRKVVSILENKTNLRFAVVNKPGAAHKIGYSYVQQTNKPTILISTSEIEDNEVINYVDQLYTLGTFKNAIVVNSQSNINSLKELYKKSQVIIGSSGQGTFSYRAMEEICKNTNCLQVQYKGASEGLFAILNNTIDTYAVTNYGINLIDNDKYKVIGHIELKNNWVRLYSKNLSDNDKKKIISTLKESSFQLN